MAKRLVICCDGTWNDPEDRTNIHWIQQHALNDGREQVVYYDRGVGTDWYNQRSGGAFGIGLSRNVRQAYRFILETYQPGDDIFCFGFSRGAFTVRSLCGFVGQVGRLESEDDIDDAYFYYRVNEPDEDPNMFERMFRPETRGPLSIRFVGVFDTVGSLGVPFEISDDKTADVEGSLFERAKRAGLGIIDRLGDRLRRPIKGFHDTRLGTIVQHAYHALAIDETRAMFAPTLWTAPPGQATRVTADGSTESVPQSVEQVWFAGVHSDVGGGYQDSPRLADVPLLWMVEKAAAQGLKFDPAAVDALRAQANALAPQHDSMTETWRDLHDKLNLEPILRPMTNAERRSLNPSGDKFPEVHTPESVHPSVTERVGQEVDTIVEEEPAERGAYRPSNLRPR